MTATSFHSGVFVVHPSKGWLFFNINELTFRHHVFVKTSHKEVQLAEVGPRFEMKRMSYFPQEL